MAPETQETPTTASTPETVEQQPTDPQTTTPETGGNGASQVSTTPSEPTKLPEDHPLVKKLGIQKQEISTFKSDLAEARAQAARTTKLEQELSERPTKEAVETLQTRYDRLEAFAQKVGLGSALDSRTFTKDLFESDKDIDTLVKEWNQKNPSQTSAALAATAANPSAKGPTPNELLRAALG